MAISKIKSVVVGNEWSNSNGTFYSHTYEMEDGTKIQANHKTQQPHNVGEEVEYEITKTDDYGNKGKVGKPKPAFGSGGYKPDTIGITVGAAMNQAVSLVAAKIIEMKDVKPYASRLTEIALELKEEFKNKQ